MHLYSASEIYNQTTATATATAIATATATATTTIPVRLTESSHIGSLTTKLPLIIPYIYPTTRGPLFHCSTDQGHLMGFLSAWADASVVASDILTGRSVESNPPKSTIDYQGVAQNIYYLIYIHYTYTYQFTYSIINNYM